MADNINFIFSILPSIHYINASTVILPQFTYYINIHHWKRNTKPYTKCQKENNAGVLSQLDPPNHLVRKHPQGVKEKEGPALVTHVQHLTILPQIGVIEFMTFQLVGDRV